MDYLLLIASLNLVLQVSILAMVVSGYILKRKMRFRAHGTLMLVAVVMQFFSFLLIMGPSFFSLAENGLFQRPIWLSAITLFHASLGGISLATGIWIAASWHLQTSTVNCIKRKRIMLYLIVTWIFALILGAILYLLLYMFA